MIYLCYSTGTVLYDAPDRFWIYFGHKSLSECPRTTVLQSDIIVEVPEMKYPETMELGETYALRGRVVKDRYNRPDRWVEMVFELGVAVNGQDVMPKLHYIEEIEPNEEDFRAQEAAKNVG